MYLLQEFTVLYLIPAQDVCGPQDNPTPAPLLPYDQVKISGRNSTRKGQLGAAQLLASRYPTSPHRAPPASRGASPPNQTSRITVSCPQTAAPKNPKVAGEGTGVSPWPLI